MDFPCIGSLVDLEKELGSKISRYHVFSPFCSIDFDLGAFELSDGRCYLICGTAIDDYYCRSLISINQGAYCLVTQNALMAQIITSLVKLTKNIIVISG